jgi:hypothetical protein
MIFDAVDFLNELFNPGMSIGAEDGKNDLPLPPIPIPDLDYMVAWDDAIAPALPCPKCGSLELWESMAGCWRCMLCDPPTAALRLLERVETVRERKTVSQNQPGCTLAASVDKTIVESNRPIMDTRDVLEGR